MQILIVNTLIKKTKQKNKQKTKILHMEYKFLFISLNTFIIKC